MQKNALGKLVPDLFLFLKDTLCDVTTSGPQLSFHIFRESSTWHTIKKLYKTLDY